MKGCYSLRLHQPGYQNEGAVDSELEWLYAMSETGLPVPQPLATIRESCPWRSLSPGCPWRGGAPSSDG